MLQKGAREGNPKPIEKNMEIASANTVFWGIQSLKNRAPV